MAKTFWDIKAKVWNLLGQKSTSITFSNTVVGDAINSRILDFLRWKISSLIDPNRIYSAGKLWIREWSVYTRTVLSSSLTQDFTIWGTLYCDTTNLASSGWVDIAWEQISYTAKTSTTLTGTSTSTILHKAGEEVKQLYVMPANFEKPISIYVIDDVTGEKIFDIPLWQEWRVIYYEIIKKSTANLIKIVWIDSNALVEIRYSWTYTNLVNDADICVIPDHYGESVIAYIVAGELGLDKGLPNAQNLLVRGYANLQNCYQYFNSETDTVTRTIKPKSYSFNSMRVWRTIR